MGEGHARRWQADALRESDGMRMARLCDDLRRKRRDHESSSNNNYNSNSNNNHNNNAPGGGGGGGGGKARANNNGPAHDVKRVDSREGAGSVGGGSGGTGDGVGGSGSGVIGGGEGNLSARSRRRASLMSPAGAALGGRLV